MCYLPLVRGLCGGKDLEVEVESRAMALLLLLNTDRSEMRAPDVRRADPATQAELV